MRLLKNRCIAFADKDLEKLDEIRKHEQVCSRSSMLRILVDRRWIEVKRGEKT